MIIDRIRSSRVNQQPPGALCHNPSRSHLHRWAIRRAAPAQNRPHARHQPAAQGIRPASSPARGAPVATNLPDVARFSALEAERKANQSRTEELQARRNALSRHRPGQGQGETAPTRWPRSLDWRASQDQRRAPRRDPGGARRDADVGAQPAARPGAARRRRERQRRVAPLGHAAQLRRSGQGPCRPGAPLGLDFDTGAWLGCALRSCAGRSRPASGPRPVHARRADARAYTERYTPHIVNREVLEGTGQLPSSGDQMFWVHRGEEARRGRRAGKREQYPDLDLGDPLTNSVREQVLAAAQPADPLTAHSPCFRSEAGSAGRDTRGMIRQHQFDKVEMVQIVAPETSYAALEQMTGHAEAILQKPSCRTASSNSAPATSASARPRPTTSRSGCRRRAPTEISSCSNCEAFQARRMQTRYKTAQGRNEFVHTLNGSGPCRRLHAGRHPRERPAGRRQHRAAGGAVAVHGRREGTRA